MDFTLLLDAVLVCRTTTGRVRGRKTLPIDPALWHGSTEVVAMTFVDRVDAGRRLAAQLGHLQGEQVVVLGLPRGGVPVAFEVARALGAMLDVIVVRKLGVPWQPELAMGAIGEDGVRVINDDIVRRAGVSPNNLAKVETRERAALEQRARTLRSGRPRVDLTGRVAVIVDDGIATGSTTRAACQVARRLGAGRIVVAVPVAPRDWIDRLRHDADEFVCVETPANFHAVGQAYRQFTQTTDDQVVALLDDAAIWARPPSEASADATGEGVSARNEEVEIPVGAVRLAGHLAIPDNAIGLVLFAHGSGSSRHSPRNRFVADVLHQAGLGTLLFDLLTTAEEHDRSFVFDIELLARRLSGATRWLRSQPHLTELAVGYFGASTGAAAAIVAASEAGSDVAAVVSRGGRPDLATSALSAVKAPTLLIVGGDDPVVLHLNRQAAAELTCEKQLVVIPGATHLFEEPGALDAVATSARDWFVDHLGR